MALPKISPNAFESHMFHPITKRYYWPPGMGATGRHMIFSGPDYIRDYRAKQYPDDRYVGEEEMSVEASGDLQFLMRPDWDDAPQWRPKHKRPGEVGWDLHTHIEWSFLPTKYHIRKGEFRQRQEDKHTHKYQEPCYELPGSWHDHWRRPLIVGAAQRARPQSSPTNRNGMYEMYSSSSSSGGGAPQPRRCSATSSARSSISQRLNR